MAFFAALSILVSLVCLSTGQMVPVVPSKVPVCPLRHGFCSPLVSSALYPAQICKEDRHCKTNQKCCRDRCGGLCKGYCPIPCDCKFSSLSSFFPNPCLSSPCIVPGAFCRPHYCNGQATAIWYSVDVNTGACKMASRCPSTVKG